MSTAAKVGGAVAVAVKSCAGKPAAVARTTCGEAAPTLSTVLATPLEFVVLCAALTPPPPVWIVQSTTTPGTGQAFASRAVTLRGAGGGVVTDRKRVG